MEIRVTTGEIDGHRLGEVVDYPSDVALRLVSLGYAEGAGEEAPAGGAKESSKADLQKRCRALGLSDKGNKADLLARIGEWEQASDGDAEADDDEAPVLNAEVPR